MKHSLSILVILCFLSWQYSAYAAGLSAESYYLSQAEYNELIPLHPQTLATFDPDDTFPTAKSFQNNTDFSGLIAFTIGMATLFLPGIPHFVSGNMTAGLSTVGINLIFLTGMFLTLMVLEQDKGLFGSLFLLFLGIFVVAVVEFIAFFVNLVFAVMDANTPNRRNNFSTLSLVNVQMQF